jgi:hypothetical protein
VVGDRDVGVLRNVFQCQRPFAFICVGGTLGFDPHTAKAPFDENPGAKDDDGNCSRLDPQGTYRV